MFSVEIPANTTTNTTQTQTETTDQLGSKTSTSTKSSILTQPTESSTSPVSLIEIIFAYSQSHSI